MGRRSKYTAELANQIVSDIGLGLTQKDASLNAGINQDTLIRWIDTKPDFADRIARARAKRNRNWIGALSSAARNGDVRAICALLDRCAPEYRTTSNVEISGPNGGPIATRQDTSIYTKDELRELAQMEQRAIARAKKGGD